MSRTSRRFKESNQILSQYPCKAPGCTKNRIGVNPYCHTHSNRVRVYGHPNGFAVPRDVYTQELGEVSLLFARYKDHPGLLSACKWLDDWIEEASRGEALVGNRTLGRIHVKQIQGRPGLSSAELLTEVTAVWLFSRRYPQRLPDDLRLSFAMSRNMARLASFARMRYGDSKWSVSKQPPGTELRAIGERIRNVLAAFFINVEVSLKKQEDKANEFKSSLSFPFVD